jgi:ribosomal protein L1
MLNSNKRGKHRLPNVPRPRMSICILADAADIDRAKQIELEYMSVDDLKKCVSTSSLGAVAPDIRKID